MMLLLILALQAPAYVTRGDRIEALYRDFAAQVQIYDTTLREAAAKEFPDLVTQLTDKPAVALVYGYQILPRIVADQPPSNKPPSLEMTPFSWPRTQDLLSAVFAKLTVEQIKLAGILSAPNRRAAFESAIDFDKRLLSDQKIIEQYIQYNRLWQKAIADDRARFDKQTALLDALIQGTPFQTHREEDFVLPTFLKRERVADGSTVITVPVYTDIRRADFLAAARSAIERVWQVHTTLINAQIRVDFRSYGVSLLPDGTHLSPANIEEHVRKFPKDGAVLTTGAEATFAVAGRFVVLGASDTTPNVIAHEFGHLLGFHDGYFRGYRDRGDDGFEILEVIPDVTDIMCAPGNGRVFEDHFRVLFK